MKIERDKLLRSLSGLFIFAAVYITGTNLRAEVKFGYHNVYGPGGMFKSYNDLSKKGCFVGYDNYQSIKGFKSEFTAKDTFQKQGIFPRINKPWTSSGEATVFGVKFQYPITDNNGYPGQLDKYPNRIPLFDRAVIYWGENVPTAGTLAACIRTIDGELVRLSLDNDKKIYPYDQTTVHFSPMTIKSFNVGIRPTADGAPVYVDVTDIRLYAFESKDAINSMAVWQPDFQTVVFNKDIPGMIESLAPFTPFCYSNRSDYYHANGIFEALYFMNPVIEIDGRLLYPNKESTPVRVLNSEKADILNYTLNFTLSDSSRLGVDVRNTFRCNAERAFESQIKSSKLPKGAKLGFVFYGADRIFGKYSGPEAPKIMTTPAGEFKIVTSGKLLVAREKAGEKKTFKLNRGNKLNAMDKVRFITFAEADSLDIAFSLPLGADGKLQPKTLNYTWRPALADSGDSSVEPFNYKDMELLETIDCGNPDDPHQFYDSTNDPLLDILRRKHGKLKGTTAMGIPYGFLPFADHKPPERGAVPLTTIAGKKCRAIPSPNGAYFRYDLKTKLQFNTPYLLIIEHAFDKVRRGEFHSMQLDKTTGELVADRKRILWGGFETDTTSGDVFRTEAFFGYLPSLTRGFSDRVSSLVFSNVYWFGGGRTPGPGPAIRSIKLYRVKTMPSLPDLRKLEPELEQARTLTVLTEYPDPLMFFEYPKLIGYNGIATNTSITRYLGGVYGGIGYLSRLPGTELLFATAARENLYVNMHLGMLLNLGFENSDHDSFTGSFWHSYWGENVPFRPTEAELKHIAAALEKSLPPLVRYSSLRDISLADNISWPCVWTKRNLEDFCLATGVKLQISPIPKENAVTLLDAGPEVLAKWRKWACAERFKFHQWLLKEIHTYRPDLRVTLSRTWYHGLNYLMQVPEPIKGAVKLEKLHKQGITTYLDFLRFMGIDPDLYAENPNFSMELDTGNELHKHPIPDFYSDGWFKRIKKDFAAGGLSIMRSFGYDECPKPFLEWGLNFFANRIRYRRGLVDALLYANARNITLPTYSYPWVGRIADLREFSTAFRLLPFAEPEPFEGKITDTVSQAGINKYGNRHGLINAGNNSTDVILIFPERVERVFDLSSGVRQELRIKSSRVEISMSPWSLKTLEIE